MHTRSSAQNLDPRRWKQVARGQWTRPLDSIEAFFHTTSSGCTTSGVTYNMVHVGATLLEELGHSPRAIEMAWKSLRYHHPRIACTVEHGTLHYQTPSEEDIQDWILRTLVVDNSGKSSLELLATLAPLPMGMLLVLPHNREVVFRIPHHHIDGIGAIQFLDSIVDALRNPPAQVQFGDEHKNLPESLATILDCGPPTASDTAKAHELTQGFSRGMSLLSLGPRDKTGSCCAVQTEQHVFSVDETATVCARAREAGLTVTHLCHSAMIQIVHSFTDLEALDYTSFFYINLRGHLAAQNKSPGSPVSLRLTALPGSLSMKQGQGFWELAHDLKKMYMLGKSLEHAVLHRPIYELIAKAPAPPSNSANVSLSSIGVVERHVGRGLADFWIGSSSPSAEVAVYVWTFQRRLTFSVWFNAAYHHRSEARDFLQLIRLHLLSEAMSAR